MQIIRLALFLVCISFPAFACEVNDESAMGCSEGQEFSTFSCSCEPKAATSTERHGKDENNPHAIVGDPPAEYLSCTVDADCTIEAGLCGDAMAVNTSHAATYRAASAEANSVILCRRAADYVAVEYTAACVNQRCERQPVKQ